MWKKFGRDCFPNRMTAIMDFNGSLHIDQSFTANGNLLKSAASKIQFGAMSTKQEQQEYNIVVSNLLQAIRNVANMLGRTQLTTPPQKTGDSFFFAWLSYIYQRNNPRR